MIDGLRHRRRGKLRMNCGGNRMLFWLGRKRRGRITRGLRCDCRGVGGRLNHGALWLCVQEILSRDLHLFRIGIGTGTLVFKDIVDGNYCEHWGHWGCIASLDRGRRKDLTEAFQAGLVNEVAFFIAPAVMGTIPRALGKFTGANPVARGKHTPSWRGYPLSGLGLTRINMQPAPKGRTLPFRPGQRPGAMEKSGGALKGRPNLTAILVTPFGTCTRREFYPGRCPGLAWMSPLWGLRRNL